MDFCVTAVRARDDVLLGVENVQGNFLLSWFFFFWFLYGLNE